MSIYQLINEIDTKEIVLPAIQRDFVWDIDRIRLLFDSIMRGYPIGIVLLWDTYQPIQFRYFDHHFTPEVLHTFEENKAGKRMKLVLDGQQRLSSIYVALKGQYEGRCLYLDILSGREKDDYSEEKYDFQFYTVSEAADVNLAQQTAKRINPTGNETDAEELTRHYVRIADIIGQTPKELLTLRQKIATDFNLHDVDKLRLEETLLTLGHALTGNEEILRTQTIDSQLPSDDRKRKSVFDILEIFVRINRQGIPLSRSDLIVSMLRLYWKEASEILPAFVGQINEGNGLSIDNDFVIRCMFATAGLGTRLDIDRLRIQSNIDKVKACYKTCFEAIRAAVDFVRMDCHIDSNRLLGGITTLVPFVQYLYYAPKQSFPKGNKTAATKSLYLFAFSKVFTQHSESRTGAFIKDSLPSADKISSGTPFSYEDAVSFVYHRAKFEAADERLFENNPDLALALVQQKSGGKIKHAGNAPEIDHIFPQKMLYEKNLKWHEVNDLGNLWILPQRLNRNKGAKHPKQYLSDVEKKFLEEAFIDLSKLNLNGYRSFVKNRRLSIVKKVGELTGLKDQDFAHIDTTEAHDELEAVDP